MPFNKHTPRPASTKTPKEPMTKAQIIKIANALKPILNQKPKCGLDPGNKDTWNIYSIVSKQWLKDKLEPQLVTRPLPKPYDRRWVKLYQKYAKQINVPLPNTHLKKLHRRRKRKRQKSKDHEYNTKKVASQQRRSDKINKLPAKDKPIKFDYITQVEITATASTRRYYHESKFNLAKNVNKMWQVYASNDSATNNYKLKKNKVFFMEIIKKIEQERINKRDPDRFKTVKKDLEDMPTKKTASMDKLRDYLSYSTQRSGRIVDFNMFNTTRKWRWNSYLGKQKVIF